jgi:hypothetical protein
MIAVGVRERLHSLLPYITCKHQVGWPNAFNRSSINEERGANSRIILRMIAHYLVTFPKAILGFS